MPSVKTFKQRLYQYNLKVRTIKHAYSIESIDSPKLQELILALIAYDQLLYKIEYSGWTINAAKKLTSCETIIKRNIPICHLTYQIVKYRIKRRNSF
jgi:hypothetical protein